MQKNNKQEGNKMKIYNIIRAILFSKKHIYRVMKGNDIRYVFASSIEQCQSKFTKYMVIKVI
jgi:hypothetical protein